MLTTFSGRNASQNEWELASFVALLVDRHCTKYCEIGARHGDTFHEILRQLKPGSTGVAVDLPGGLWGTSASRDALSKATSDLHRLGYKASMLFGDSQTDATRRLIVGRGPYDAILIDGDHTYKGVAKDWELYGELAPIVAFHDIVGADQAEKVFGNAVEVPRLWQEIKASGLKTIEFVAPESKMGIGVVLR